MKNANNNFESVDPDEIFDELDSHQGKALINRDNVKNNSLGDCQQGDDTRSQICRGHMEICPKTVCDSNTKQPSIFGQC